MYRGDNVHAYTSDIKEMLPKLRLLIDQMVPANINYNELFEEIEHKLGRKDAIQNIKNSSVYAQGSHTLKDNDLEGIDCLHLLFVVWQYVKDNPSLQAHFSATLDQVGMTCIQGISHRIIGDIVACTDLYRL